MDNNGNMGDVEINNNEQHVSFIWPEPFEENNENNELWPNLSADLEEVEKWVLENKRILMRCITWNLCAKDPPHTSEMKRKLIPQNKYESSFILRRKLMEE